MIATAIAVGSDGATIVSSGATYGILLAILFAHGLVCSAATNVLARLNLFYVIVNSKYWFTRCRFSDLIFFQQLVPL